MVKRRPALDVDSPDTPTEPSALSLSDVIASIVDDFHPFAIGDERPWRAKAADPAARQVTRRRVFFTTDDDRRHAAQALLDELGSTVIVHTVDVVDDGAAWAERSQAAVRAVRAGKIIIAPPWDVPPPDPQTIRIVIRPSMGFGTGHHASTRLCALALQEQHVAGRTVTDIGTGSGVLAIAAAKLGAGAVLALESDRDAVSCAAENVATNGVDARVTIRADELGVAPPPPPSDVVIANLTGGAIARLGRAITHAASPGGALILSGLTVDEVPMVTEAVAPFATLCSRTSDDEWACLVLQTRLGTP